MKVDIIRPDELDSSDVAGWQGLQATVPGLDSPFLSPHFVQAVGRVRNQARVAVLSDDSGARGYLPFERGRRGHGRALGMGLSDVQALVAPATLEMDLGRVLSACGLRLFRFDHLLAVQQSRLDGLPSRLTRETSGALDLRSGFDAYARDRQATSKSLFQSTARKRRKLEREVGPVRLGFHQPDHGLLERVLAWKSQQYRRTGRRDRFADPGVRALVHDLLDVRTPAFAAPLTVLYAGDAVVAAHVGLRSRSTLAWWFPVYDPAYGAYSPGLVLCLDLARVMPDEGLSLLDLGKGDEPYKERLSNVQIDLFSGSVAIGRATQVAQDVRSWPTRLVTRLVLGSPTLRRFSRSALARAGELRERVTPGR